MSQEPMSRSMQLTYIPVTVFSSTDFFLDRISMRQFGNTFLSQKKRYTKNRPVCKTAVT